MVDRDVAKPNAGQVAVRMLCSPINPSDLLFVQGRYTTLPEFPQIPGFEGVGIVEAAGGSLRGRLFRGKRVVVLNQQGGTWSKNTVVSDSQVVPVPKSFTDVEAATSFVNPMTAWMMVQHVLRVPKGGWLIQTAAGSILGRMVIRLGQSLGFQTVNVVRSEQAANRCREAGAQHVIQWDESVDSANDLKNRVTKAAGASALMYAIDAVSGQTGTAVLQCLSRNGKFLAYGTLSAEPLTIPTRQMMSNQWSIDSFWLGHRMQQLNLVKKLKVIRKVQRLIQAGILVTPVASVVRLAELQSALALIQEQNCDGRVLLSMS
ncbi:MAG: zinc-dependent alcohol dehydrogenase family protein [Fuerstiella sp.]